MNAEAEGDKRAESGRGEEAKRCPFHEGGAELELARAFLLATDFSREGIRLAGALVPQLPREPGATSPPQVADYSPDVPRPGIRALRKWLAVRSLTEESGVSSWGQLTFDEQVVGRTRLWTQADLGKLIEKLWRDVKAPLAQGYLPLTWSIGRAIGLRSDDRNTTVGRYPFLLVKADESLARRVGSARLDQLATFVRSQLSPFYCAAVEVLERDPKVASTVRDVDALLQYRNNSAASVIGKGLACGTNTVVSTLELLFDLARQRASTGGKTLSEADIENLAADNQAFVFELTQISFLALVKLNTIIYQIGTSEVQRGLRNLISRITGEDPSTLPDESMIPTERLNPKYFCLREYTKPGHTEPSLLLDFDLSAFTAADWDALASVGPILGCAAGSVNQEFIPLMSRLFSRAALPLLRQ